MAQEVLQRKDTAIDQALYVSFELADKAWKLTFGTRGGARMRVTMTAGKPESILQAIARAKVRLGLAAQSQVVSWLGSIW